MSSWFQAWIYLRIVDQCRKHTSELSKRVAGDAKGVVVQGLVLFTRGTFHLKRVDDPRHEFRHTHCYFGKKQTVSMLTF